MGHSIIGCLIEVHKGFNELESLVPEFMADKTIFDLIGGEAQKDMKKEDAKIELERDIETFKYNPALFVEQRWLKYILRKADEGSRLKPKLAEQYFEEEKYDSLDEIERRWMKEKGVEYKVFKETLPEFEPSGSLGGRVFATYCLGVEQAAPIFYKHVNYRLRKLGRR